jgi:hypothetical protein
MNLWNLIDILISEPGPEELFLIEFVYQHPEEYRETSLI